MPKIASVHAREILDSRGNPTLEVDVVLDNGAKGRAAVPSGASTGSREALELRDGDKSRFGGKGVQKAIDNVNDIIAPALNGAEASDQEKIDQRLIDLDGTEYKKTLGANAILGVSLATCRATAGQVPLYQHIAKQKVVQLPVPMFNVLNGGAHADNSVDLQEFMIAPMGAKSFHEALRMGAETYQSLKSVLKKKGYGTAIGDEGGFAPNLKSNIEAVEVVLEGIAQAGYKPGKDIVLALDPAASEFYEDGAYVFKKSDKSRKSAEEMIAFYEDWVRQFPILSIEDGLAEGDREGWKLMTERMGKKIQLVGDDIFVTNPKIIKQAIQDKIANAALIKLNQIGTLTETLEAIATARSAGYGIVISHRSGETSDDFIADFAVATQAGQIKTGAPCRGERVAKYNQLMRIEDELGTSACYAGSSPFQAFIAS